MMVYQNNNNHNVHVVVVNINSHWHKKLLKSKTVTHSLGIQNKI